MTKKYVAPKIQLYEFSCEDVVTASLTLDDGVAFKFDYNWIGFDEGGND